MTPDIDAPARPYALPARPRIHALAWSALVGFGLVVAAVIGLHLWIQWSGSALDRRVRAEEPGVTRQANDLISRSPQGCRPATDLPPALAGLGHWEQVCITTSASGGRQLSLDAKVDDQGAVAGVIYANGTPDSPDTCLHHLHGGWWQDASSVTCPPGWSAQGGP